MKLRVYSRRWGHDDFYKIAKTQDGWDISNISIGGKCDKQGKPSLFRNFEQDHINYPHSIGTYLEILWDEAESKQLTDEQIQKELDEISSWLEATEMSTPKGIFEGYIGGESE